MHPLYFTESPIPCGHVPSISSGAFERKLDPILDNMIFLKVSSPSFPVDESPILWYMKLWIEYIVLHVTMKPSSSMDRNSGGSKARVFLPQLTGRFQRSQHNLTESHPILATVTCFHVFRQLYGNKRLTRTKTRGRERRLNASAGQHLGG